MVQKGIPVSSFRIMLMIFGCSKYFMFHQLYTAYLCIYKLLRHWTSVWNCAFYFDAFLTLCFTSQLFVPLFNPMPFMNIFHLCIKFQMIFFFFITPMSFVRWYQKCSNCVKIIVKGRLRCDPYVRRCSIEWYIRTFSAYMRFKTTGFHWVRDIIMKRNTTQSNLLHEDQRVALSLLSVSRAL